ncbi:MAG: hypothetical protein PHT99_09925 [Methanoregula sp.]|nr:hypothetical protein [Methanoregula sp.]
MNGRYKGEPGAMSEVNLTLKKKKQASVNILMNNACAHHETG